MWFLIISYINTMYLDHINFLFPLQLLLDLTRTPFCQLHVSTFQRNHWVQSVMPISQVVELPTGEWAPIMGHTLEENRCSFPQQPLSDKALHLWLWLHDPYPTHARVLMFLILCGSCTANHRTDGVGWFWV